MAIFRSAGRQCITVEQITERRIREGWNEKNGAEQCSCTVAFIEKSAFYRGLSLRRKAQKTEKHNLRMENRFLIPLYDPIEKRPENRVYIPYIYKEGDTNKE